jgi:hypothetical protein
MSGVRTAVGRPLRFRHLRGFHGRPEILRTIQNPVYVRQHCHQKLVYKLESFSCSFVRPETKLSVLCSITTNCHSDLHGTNTTEHERTREK